MVSSPGGLVRLIRLSVAVLFSPVELVTAIDFKPCLPNASTAKPVHDANGILRPFRVGSGNWDAPMILGRIAQILLNEVVGIEADFSNQFGGAADLIRNMTGCLDEECTRVEDWPYIQFDFENWFTVAGDKILKAQPTALVRGYIGYDGQEGLYVKKTIADKVWEKHKLPLVYYQSLFHPSRMWMEYLAKPSEISIPSDSGCRGNTAVRMKEVGLICDPDGWWYSPACAKDKDTCIPVLMGGVGWLGLETAQVINYTSMPMAVTFIGWPDQRILNGSVNAFFFWWRPDWSYNSIGTVERFLFPKHDRAAWDKGIFETDFPDFQLTKHMAHQVSQVSYKAAKMFEGFTFNWIEINQFMDIMEARKKNDDPDRKSTLACEWVKANKDIWQRWIPDREPCKAGEGLKADGSCSRCLPGTKSSFDTTDNEFMCVNCTSGRYSNSQGGTSCEACAAGRFGSSSKMTECERCSTKGYTPDVGYEECISCGGEGVPLATEYPGAENASACACPRDYYRDVVNTMKCHPCPQGMTCAWGSDTRAGASIYPLLKPIYWSPVSNPLSVYMCDDENRCPGGKPGTCGPNMHKPSCAHCTEGWVFDGTKCKECDSVEKTQLIFPTCLILILPILVIFLYKVLSDQYSKWGSWQNGFMSVGFILLNHYQVISMLTGVNMKLPDSMTNYYRFWSITSDMGTVFNPQCAGYDFNKGLIFKTIFPAIYLAIGWVVWLASRLYPYVRMEGNRTFNAVTSMLLTFFAGIVSLSLTLFICKNNPNDTSSLAADRSITCFEEDWNGMLAVGIVAVLLWCGGVGSMFAWAIFTQTGKMQSLDVQMRWKFLFIKFRADRYWWALAFLAKGVMLNSGLVVLKNGVSQIFWMMCILTFYSSLVCCCMPWRHRVINILDITTHMFLILSGSCLLWFAKDFVSERDRLLLNDDLAKFGIAFSLLCGPIALISCSVIFWTQMSNRSKRMKEDEMAKIRFAFTCVAKASDEVFRSLAHSLPEWDYWFLREAANTIMFEYLSIKSRAGYTTVQLDESEKKQRVSESPYASEGSDLQTKHDILNGKPSSNCESQKLLMDHNQQEQPKYAVTKVIEEPLQSFTNQQKHTKDKFEIPEIPHENMEQVHASHLLVVAVSPRAVPEGRLTMPRTPRPATGRSTPRAPFQATLNTTPSGTPRVLLPTPRGTPRALHTKGSTPRGLDTPRM